MLPEADHLHLTISGGGDPYSVVGPLRRRLLFGLHRGLAIPELARALDMPEASVEAEIQPLAEASLVAWTERGPRPTIFIADADAVRQTRPLAAEIGSSLAERVVGYRDELERAFGTLACAVTHDLAAAGFVLIGDLVLDVGLLMALWREATLLPPPPRRPSPTWPDAAYHCWMVEGSHDDLGVYGHRSITLSSAEYAVITFGRYVLADGSRNLARERFQDGVVQTAGITPSILATRLGVPFLGTADVGRWMSLASRLSGDLVTAHKAFEPPMREVFQGLSAARYAPDGFAEFFCWLDHLAYADAVDRLVAGGLFDRPTREFAAAVVDERELWARSS